jgi:hypothetical protein
MSACFSSTTISLFRIVPPFSHILRFIARSASRLVLHTQPLYDPHKLKMRLRLFCSSVTTMVLFMRHISKKAPCLREWTPRFLKNWGEGGLESSIYERRAQAGMWSASRSVSIALHRIINTCKIMHKSGYIFEWLHTGPIAWIRGRKSSSGQI